ncbi:hypothetical protein HPB48_016078 [Haemaphysalis longicornis]|uniref:Uncharacterized protein n=1 Tax=Haemaphysalis longicornis TaxID=44386 RepID=A0A9J6GTF1_HAELO|nr:hypothetical protein HPB48_016078 [Haemaphysalis longicornis]
MINPMRSSSDTSSLRKLNDHVLFYIRGLGVKRSSFLSMLSDILLRGALPHDIVLQYNRTGAVETPTARADAFENLTTGLDRLLKFLSTDLENV